MTNRRFEMHEIRQVLVRMRMGESNRTTRVVIDNPKCAITRACYHDPEVQRAYADCAEAYGFLIAPCPVRDPQKKGRVESNVKYIKNAFVPLREFRGMSDANQQLKQ